MVSLLFVVVVAFHGAIHIMGFLKAFQLAKIDTLKQPIGKPIGALWLFSAISFVATALLFLLKVSGWPIIAFAAIILSQFLIFKSWKDAKYGTIINLIIICVSIPGYGKYSFDQLVNEEKKSLIAEINYSDPTPVTQSDINHLPLIVQKWMYNSGVVGKPIANSVWLTQKGQMKTKPEAEWIPFEAEQFFNVNQPSFIWVVDAKANALMHMHGRDKLANGNGEMLIKLFSLINVVDEKSNPKINSAAKIRFLSEICWFPAAALNKQISWTPIDSLSAKATLTINESPVSGIFKFNTEGEVIAFEAIRYFGSGENDTQEQWLIENTSHTNFNGYHIPNKSTVTWKLKEGDFKWLELEVTELEYNTLKN